MKTYTFYKEDGRWYIDEPRYLEQGGSKGDLQMVDGADIMLDIMAEGKDAVTVTIDTEPFVDADLVELQERCDPIIGGGNYFMHSFENREVNRRMWLCGVTEFVFGHLPEKIYVRREEL